MQRQMEIKSFKEDLENNNRQIVHDEKEFEKLVDEMEKLKVCMLYKQFCLPDIFENKIG